MNAIFQGIAHLAMLLFGIYILYAGASAFIQGIGLTPRPKNRKRG